MKNKLRSILFCLAGIICFTTATGQQFLESSPASTNCGVDQFVTYTVNVGQGGLSSGHYKISYTLPTEFVVIAASPASPNNAVYSNIVVNTASNPLTVEFDKTNGIVAGFTFQVIGYYSCAASCDPYNRTITAKFEKRDPLDPTIFLFIKDAKVTTTVTSSDKWSLSCGLLDQPKSPDSLWVLPGGKLTFFVCISAPGSTTSLDQPSLSFQFNIPGITVTKIYTVKQLTSFDVSSYANPPLPAFPGTVSMPVVVIDQSIPGSPVPKLANSLDYSMLPFNNMSTPPCQCLCYYVEVVVPCSNLNHGDEIKMSTTLNATACGQPKTYSCANGVAYVYIPTKVVDGLLKKELKIEVYKKAAGCSGKYEITFKNITPLPIKDIVIKDMALPNGIDINKITLSGAPAKYRVTYYYKKCNAGTISNGPITGGVDHDILNVSGGNYMVLPLIPPQPLMTLGLPTNVYTISGFSISFDGKLKPAKEISIVIDFTISKKNKCTGQPINPPGTKILPNCVDASYDTDLTDYDFTSCALVNPQYVTGPFLEKDRCSDTIILKPIPWLSMTKRECSPQCRKVDDVVTFQIVIQNIGSTELLIGYNIKDILDPGFDFVIGSAKYAVMQNVRLPNRCIPFQGIPLIPVPRGNNEYRIFIKKPLGSQCGLSPIDEFIILEFKAKINDKAPGMDGLVPRTSMNNTISVYGSNLTQTFTARANVCIKREDGAGIEKLIKLPNGQIKSPYDPAFTLKPGDQFTYLLRYYNIGTKDLVNIRVLDMLPFDNDRYMVNCNYPRGSSSIGANALQVNPGITVSKYNLPGSMPVLLSAITDYTLSSTNLVSPYPNLSGNADFGPLVNQSCVSSLPTLATQPGYNSGDHGILIRTKSGVELQKGQMLEIAIPVTIPQGTPNGTLYCNSFIGMSTWKNLPYNVLPLEQKICFTVDDINCNNCSFHADLSGDQKTWTNICGQDIYIKCKTYELTTSFTCPDGTGKILDYTLVNSLGQVPSINDVVVNAANNVPYQFQFLKPGVYYLNLYAGKNGMSSPCDTCKIIFHVNCDPCCNSYISPTSITLGSASTITVDGSLVKQQQFSTLLNSGGAIIKNLDIIVVDYKRTQSPATCNCTTPALSWGSIYQSTISGFSAYVKDNTVPIGFIPLSGYAFTKQGNLREVHYSFGAGIALNHNIDMSLLIPTTQAPCSSTTNIKLKFIYRDFTGKQCVEYRTLNF